jgi:hypothetical protein
MVIVGSFPLANRLVPFTHLEQASQQSGHPAQGHESEEDCLCRRERFLVTKYEQEAASEQKQKTGQEQTIAVEQVCATLLPQLLAMKLGFRIGLKFLVM